MSFMQKLSVTNQGIEEKIQLIRLYEMPVLFVTQTLVYIFVFYKLRFKIDLNGTLSLGLLMLITTLRLVADFVTMNFEKSKVDIIFLIQIPLLTLFWYTIYNYTIEMLRIKLLIESQSPQIYQRNAKIVSRIKIFLIGFYITAVIVKLPCDISRMMSQELY
jgi:hypothetical protein